MYNVRLEAFEGPFDLLVYLIEKSRMNIYDINVAEITEQYIEYMNKMNSLDVSLSSEFLVLAATLILLKSKMLLPVESSGTSDEQDDEGKDPRTPLVERIIEYKKFKYAAGILSKLEDRGLCIFSKPQEDLSLYMLEKREAPVKLNVTDFLLTFSRFLLRKKRIEDIRKKYSHLERERVSLEDKMTSMMDILSNSHEFAFSDLIKEEGDLFDVVLTFMSMLELLKDKSLTAEQEEAYGEIILKYNNPE